jgi:hypothetical protein
MKDSVQKKPTAALGRAARLLAMRTRSPQANLVTTSVVEARRTSGVYVAQWLRHAST